jgi:hypothetical protein
MRYKRIAFKFSLLAVLRWILVKYDMGNEAKIIELLEKIAENVENIVASIPKPASFGRRVIEILITIATIAGILGAIDVIKNWLGG